MKHKPSIPDYSESHHNPQSSLLDPFNCPSKRQKPQISSIPGVSPKEPNRYRVILAGQILGDRLTADDALELAAKEGGSAIAPSSFNKNTLS